MKRTSCVGALLLAALAGCQGVDDGVPVTPDGEKTNPLGYEVIPLENTDRKEKAASFFLRNLQDGSNNTGISTSEYLCMLTTVYGNFGDYNGSVNVFVSPLFPGMWQTTKYGGPAGQAVCTRWSNFVGPPGSGILLGDAVELTKYTNGTATANLWWGDAISYLTGVAGQFQGFAENIWITQSTNASTPSVLNVRTQQGNDNDDTTITGRARSLFVGNSQLHTLVKLYGIQTSTNTWVKGNINTPGLDTKFAVGDAGGFSSQWLAPTDLAVCYLTRVSGDFNSTAQKITIYQNGTQWFLDEMSEAYGTARCMAYDQR